MTINFHPDIKNKVKIIGVVKGQRCSCDNGLAMYTMVSVRPQVNESEWDFSGERKIEDCHHFLAENMSLNHGDLVKIIGHYVMMSGFTGNDTYTCPVCGSKQSDKIALPVIKTKKVKVIESGDYRTNMKIIEEKTTPTHWNNHIVISNVDSTTMLGRNAEWGIGDYTFYNIESKKKNDKSFESIRWGALHKGCDEFIHDRYYDIGEHDKICTSYIGKNIAARKGKIIKATGNIAMLQKANDAFLCENCGCYSTIDRNFPVIFFDKQPDFKENN